MMPHALLHRWTDHAERRALYWWRPKDGRTNMGDQLSQVIVSRVLGLRDLALMDKRNDGQRLFAIHAHLDRRNIAHLMLVGDGRDRPLDRIEHAKRDSQIVWDQRAMPTARAEGADRGQRHQLGVQRQDRPLRREVVGGRSSRRGHQYPVADQLRQDDAAIDRNLDPRRLPGLAQQRDLVDRIVAHDVAVHPGRRHLQRRDREGAGAAQALDQRFDPPFVHQEADRAPVHAEHRADLPARQHVVERLKQEPVAAQRDDLLRILERHEIIAAAQQRVGGDRRFGVRGDQRRRLVERIHGPPC